METNFSMPVTGGFFSTDDDFVDVDENGFSDDDFVRDETEKQ